MAGQHTAVAVDLWRIVAGIGVGVQLVTIDSYIAELVPKHVRGQAIRHQLWTDVFGGSGRGLAILAAAR